VGSGPDGISSDATHVWVANYGGNSVTELNASSGSAVQTIGVGSGPHAVSSDGTHVWVANNGSNTVTELNASDGSAVQTIGVGSYPVAVSSDGTHVWVVNNGNNTVTELAIYVDDAYSYAGGGGTGTAPASGSGQDSSSITLAANTFANPGYTFAGWNDGTSTYQPGDSYTLASGGSAITFTAQWTLAVPTITTFTPTSGPVGTIVTIKGTNLSGATKVTFNGVKGTITKDTAMRLKVKVPSGATTGKIKVITPGGKVKTATVFTVT
jgi:uncharacterized repeat protein (TIGR02543 family)